MTKLEIEITNHAIEYLKYCNNIYVGDLHNEIFNTDYWAIGYAQCEDEILKHCSIFKAIEIVKDYEIDNFGECTTDLSNSEKVCNMLVYILGENILNMCESYRLNIDQPLNEIICIKIQNELKNL